VTLREKIKNGTFVITAELGPPQSCNGDIVRKKTAYFKGVDGVNITDNQTAIVRMSSIASAKIVLDQGLEPVIQVTCRDRNRIGLQRDLLGAYALGIQNVLCLTGDHQKFGDHPEARGVFDLDSVQLIAMTNRLNIGKFLSGESMKTVPSFFTGGAANPFADPLEMRMIRLAKKIEAGAGFIQTQPVFDLDRFLKWMDAVRSAGLHSRTAILAGIMPVKSARALLYMQEEVPGITISEAYIERMQKAEDPKEEGIRIAKEIMGEVRCMDGISGIHIMPLLWESITPRILDD